MEQIDKFEKFDKSDDSNEILYYSLNQDNNCIAVGSKSGFKIFSTDPFQLFYESKCGPISIVEMLHTTNLVLLVGESDFGDFSPRKVTIWRTNDNSVICSFWPFLGIISLAKINKKRVIILERTFLHIYNTIEMKILHTIEIGNITPGRLFLSPSSDKNNFVCYSSSEEEGIVKVYDLLYLAFKTSIKCHKSRIMTISVNKTGELMTTCSEKGTIIRVFSLPRGDKLYTFKRGLTNATIYSMNFSSNLEKIIISSDTGTMHIFEMKQESSIQQNSGQSTETSAGIKAYICSFFSSFSSKMIPKDYEDLLNVQRSVLSYKSNILKVPNIISFNANNENEAFAFMSDGTFILFSISYDKMTITQTNECNIKNLRLII